MVIKKISTKKKKRNAHPERDEQIKLATWLNKKGIWFNASASGGKRSLLEALNFKRMGVSKGYPDISILYPEKSYHGLFIELKPIDSGRPSPEQIEWINFLRDKGYKAECCHGFEIAKKIICEYFSWDYEK